MRFPRLVSLLIVFMSVFSVFISTFNVQALSGSDFKAGRIIDDGVFINKDSMSPQQIQDFLNAKVPTCEVNHTAYNAQNPPPYTCLKDYQENITTGENNFGRYVGSTPYQVPGAKSAAQIIWEAGQTYSINPQVLIVLLQKEQALVTDTWPLLSQFTKATGYLCPDTAACNSNAGSFSKQVFGAAWQFRNDINGIDTPGFYSVYGKGWNNIRLNPNAACGTKSVYIENQATAVLYKYTPYTPNDAALNNLYGTGDGCSAYGNRNFWRYFNEWFGTGYVPPNYGTINSSSGTSSWLEYGETKTVTIVVKNLGTTTWCADGSCSSAQSPTRLVSQNYAPFALYDPTDPAWIGSAQIKMQTATVAPGATGTFIFKIKAPYLVTSASSRFYLNIGGTTFVESANAWVGANVYPTQISLTSNSGPWGLIYPNQKIKATVKIKNNSKLTLYSDKSGVANIKPFRLITPRYVSSPFYDATDPAWLSPAQIAMKTPVVAPGEDAVFEFNIKGAFAQYRQMIDLVPVIDGLTELQSLGIRYYVDNPAPQLSYSYVGATPPPASMLRNTTTNSKVTLTLRNTSNTVWRNESDKNPTRLVMVFPTYRSSPFYDATDPAWLSPAQIAMKTPVVAPGEDAVFEFNWKSLNTPGNYLEYFSLVTDGSGFFPIYGSAFRTIVN